MEIDGREWEVHPATPTYEGTTGLFHMPSAYTLPKGRFSFSLFRDNLDRDPKDEDISIHGVSLGYGLSNRLELYGNFGLQNRIDADALFQPGYVNDYPVRLHALGDRARRPQARRQVRLPERLQGRRRRPRDPRLRQDPDRRRRARPRHRQAVVGRRPHPVQEPRREGRPPRVSIGYQVNSDPETAVDLANAFKLARGPQHPRLLLAPAAGRAHGHELHAATATSSRPTRSTS